MKSVCLHGKTFDYYPRGCVEISNKGKPVVYMTPNISEDTVELIMAAFELRKLLSSAMMGASIISAIWTDNEGVLWTNSLD